VSRGETLFTIPIFLVQLLAVAFKEVRHTVRDKRMMALLLVAPALQLGVFGFAVDFDVDRVPTVVVDHDQSVLSRHHLSRILADRTLVCTLETTSDDEARAALDRNEVSAALVVPRGFGESLGQGRTAHLQVIVDGTDPNRGAVAAATVARYALSENVEVSKRILDERIRAAATSSLVETANSGGVTRAVGLPLLLSRVLHNPRLKTAIYMVPGIIALLLLVVTVIVTAMGLARERETGTLEQVLVTPMSPIVLLTGKLLPYVFIGLFDFLFAIVVATWLFGVPIHGQLRVAFVGTCAYLISTLGVGLLISTLSQTQQQAFIGGFLFLLPAILLSGIMTPLWGIPELLMPLVRANPATYYVKIVRGVLLRGSTFTDLSYELTILASMGVFILSIAALRFKRTLG
jgi:ABC-2 type transport system permease protein